MTRPDPDCEFCKGEGKVPAMAQVYPNEPHYADVGEQKCVCTIDAEDDFDEDLAISAAEELGLTPDEAERAVEDYKRL